MPAHSRQGLAISLAALSLTLAGCTSTLAPDYGVREGKFPACQSNQDCVSSQETDPKLYIVPLHYQPSHNDAQADRDQAHADLIAAINAAGPARIVSNHRHYVRVEYAAATQDRTKPDYYYQSDQAVDEAQFYLSPNSYSIDMYSVVKQSLMENGASRERLERIRAYFDKLQQQQHQRN
jgi:uncharacterized protein (DUF1499 family)